MRWLTPPILLVALGCHHEPVTTGAPERVPELSPPLPAGPAETGDVPDVEVPTWRKHKCARTVLWPAYAGVDMDGNPQPPVEDDDYGDGERRRPPEDPANPTGVGGNWTADEKLAAINKRRKSEGVCDTRHRDALENAILEHAAPAPAKTQSTTAASAFADLEHAPLVSSVLALTPSEQTQAARDGLVVSDRLGYTNYTTAYYDIHRGQLPVYVTVDSVMHAIYASHAHYLGELEHDQLRKRLDEALGAMHCGLPAAANHYAPEIVEDLDLYLTVARSLLAERHVLSELGKVDRRAAEIVALVTNPSTTLTIDLFGRQRALDTTQFTPRGHYDDGTGRLSSYFRAAMWMSRVDLNLVSRDTRASTPGYEPDPRETPREAIVAVALADLAQRSGALKNLETLDRAWGVMAGAREDVSAQQLLALAKQAKLGKLEVSDADALRKAIGSGFRRTVNTGPTPNVKNLPVIATLLGPRITPDTIATGGLIAERGPAVAPVELGYMLGSDRAATYTRDADKPMRRARKDLAAARLGGDLYSAWLTAIRALAKTPAGAKPRFMGTEAFADLRLNSILTSYGQLRHNHVLVAAQAYDQGGCEIPDGYVEPAPEAYLALAEYAKRGAATARLLDPKGGAEAIRYFTRVEKLMRVLAQISREELAGKPLSTDTRRFLAMIVERRVAKAVGYGGSFPVATFDGWYLDLFPNIETGLQSPAFISDVATYDREGKRGIHYLGAKAPRLGVFVVDTGGKPRVMIGPVARGFQHTGPHTDRIADDDVPRLTVDEPWAASYTVAAAAVPEYSVQFRRAGASIDGLRVPPPDEPADNVVRITSKHAHGAATIELLDHHFVKMAEITTTITAGTVDVTIPAQPQPVEALRIRVGASAIRFDVPLTGELRADSRDAT